MANGRFSPLVRFPRQWAVHKLRSNGFSSKSNSRRCRIARRRLSRLGDRPVRVMLSRTHCLKRESTKCHSGYFQTCHHLISILRRRPIGGHVFSKRMLPLPSFVIIQRAPHTTTLLTSRP